jgi:tRNA (guanine-N7-)-methyltransferase
LKESRAINPILDVSLHTIPLDLEKVFGNARECALEIGFGDGDFLIACALGNPGVNFLGIEIKKRRFNVAVKSAAKKKADNVKFLNMEAVIAARELFPPDSFATVYINFPDPWPKDRHERHRIVNPYFLTLISNIMKKDGVLELASDHREYVTNSLETLGAMECFSSVFDDPGYVNDIPGRPLTGYEREFREEGREIYYAKFTNLK